MIGFRFLILVVLILSMSSCTKEESHSRKTKVSSAYQALQLMAQSRSYPEPDISGGAYMEAYEHTLKYIKTKPFKNRSDNWESLGPQNIAGRTLCIDINPQNRNTIYAGSASGGLWRSFNRGLGVSWQRMPIGFPALAISSIEFAPQDSMTMYIGTGEVYNIDGAGNGAAFRPMRGTYGIGILKSVDGGNTWIKSLDWGLNQERGVWEIRVARTDPNIVYAATTIGTFKSIDAGITWVMVHDVPMTMDMEIHPTDPNIVFVGCGNLGSTGRGIYRTQDGGQTWEKAPAPVPKDFGGKIMLSIFDADPSIVYASIGNGIGFDDGFTWLCRTDDGGDNWSIVNTEDYSMFQGWFAHDIDVNPTNSEDLQAVGITIWDGQNGGSTLSNTTVGGLAPIAIPPLGEPDGPPNFTHSDHHDVLYDREDPQTIYYANDGGLYVSSDGGQTFQSINGGMCTAQFYNGMGVAQDIVNFAMGGLQDNSTVIYTGSPAWRRVIGGDGSWTAVNPENSDNHFGSSQGLVVGRHSSNFEYDFLAIPTLPNDRTAFIAPFVLAPSNPNRIYAGRSGLYRSSDNGDAFIPANNGNLINGDPIFAMEVSPTDEAVLYFATAPIDDRPSMFFTPDRGNTVIDITEGLPDRFINDVTVHPLDPNIAYVTMGGFGSGHVFMTRDAGASWTDISGDLPNVPTSAIIVDPFMTDRLYVGNDLGVFETTNPEEGWNDFNEGLIDAAIVMDLKVSTLDNKLYVATHGSGMLSRNLIEDDVVSATSDQTEALIALEVYPNPTIDKLTLKLQSDVNVNKVDVSMHNTSGQQIDANWNIAGQQEIEVIDLAPYPQGVYFITLSQGIERHTIRVMLE